MPSIGFLDERQLLQRARRILPSEKEIRVGAVVHRADLDSGFSLAVEISAFAGQQRERLDAAPGAIGSVAVEDRCVGGVDTANLHTIHRQPIRGYDERATGDGGGCRDHERIGLQGRISRSRRPGRRAGRRIRLTRSIAAHLGARLQRVGRGIGRRILVFGLPANAPTARPGGPAVRRHRAAAAAQAAGQDERCAAVAQRRRSCTGSGHEGRQRRGSPRSPPSAASPRRSRSRNRNRAAPPLTSSPDIVTKKIQYIRAITALNLACPRPNSPRRRTLSSWTRRPSPERSI